MEGRGGVSDSTFILSMTGIVVTCFSGMLVYLLKSRCTRIRCACIECDRAVISEANLRNVGVAARADEM